MAATSAQFYANLLKTFTAKVPNAVIYSAEMNEATDEIEALELILGTGLRSKTVVSWDNVSTSWASLTARLNNMDAGIRATDVTIHPQYALVSGTLVQPADTTSVALTVRGAAANSHDLVHVFNTAGSSVFAATQSAFTVGMPTTISASLTVTGTTAITGATSLTSDGSATVPSIIKGFSTQAGDLTQWQNSAGAVLAKMDPAGNLTTASLTTGGTANINGRITGTGGAFITGGVLAATTSASVIPLAARGTALQTANLQEWQNSGSTAVAWVDSVGNGVFPNILPGAMRYFDYLSVVGTTNGAGDFDIVTAIRSWTGWAQVDALMIMNGDAAAISNITFQMNSALPASTANVHVTSGSTGAAVANHGVRFNCLAWGH